MIFFEDLFRLEDDVVVVEPDEGDDLVVAAPGEDLRNDVLRKDLEKQFFN